MTSLRRRLMPAGGEEVCVGVVTGHQSCSCRAAASTHTQSRGDEPRALTQLQMIHADDGLAENATGEARAV